MTFSPHPQRNTSVIPTPNPVHPLSPPPLPMQFWDIGVARDAMVSPPRDSISWLKQRLKQKNSKRLARTLSGPAPSFPVFPESSPPTSTYRKRNSNPNV